MWLMLSILSQPAPSNIDKLILSINFVGSNYIRSVSLMKLFLFLSYIEFALLHTPNNMSFTARYMDSAKQYFLEFFD